MPKINLEWWDQNIAIPAIKFASADKCCWHSCCFVTGSDFFHHLYLFDYYNLFHRVATVLEIRQKVRENEKDENSQGKVREFEKKGGKSGKVREFDKLSERKSFATPHVQLVISVPAKMLYQEVMETSLRSGRSQGKVRENQNQKRWSHCYSDRQKQLPSTRPRKSNGNKATTLKYSLIPYFSLPKTIEFFLHSFERTSRYR